MEEMIERPFGDHGNVHWTMTVGPSGVNLRSDIPTGHGGYVGVYLDFAQLTQILTDGKHHWSKHWIQAIQEAIS